ncbi:MBL fold metallo-hydrolase [Shewanella cyperi]|uniref:MBL fold metallo-hydrolase n=1 Tax=Shewanella cyperi TaxID=2814292 RepID=A0A974XLG0_9GAMM|nr:MBL fold metallo-hydrolase [Shewanella cyperi]QSX30605.1 MBL fold metallo-hydrolase [Shewanella cyperi]
MFTLHRLQGHIQTIYLAEYADRLLLLDGCCRADVGPVCDFIRQQLKRPLTDLHLIVVTHMHPDHAGGAHKLARLSGALIAAADVPGQWYRGLDGFMMHLSDILLAKWVASRMKRPQRWLWYPRFLRPDLLLKDDEPLPCFPEWQAYHCQGHTDRDLALLHRPSGELYVADLLVRVRGRFIAPFPLFYPNRYRSSLLKVQTLAPSRVLLAHGGEYPLSEINLEEVLASAPTVPMTHWRSVKAKVRQALFGKDAA